MSKNYGPPAFPSCLPVAGTVYNGTGNPFTHQVSPAVHSGMSMRDYFAGQAIGAIIRQCASDLQFTDGSETLEQYFARKAYEVADAMMKEREK